MDRGTLVLVASDASDRGFFRRTFHPHELRLAFFATAEEACAAFPLPEPVVAIVSLAENGLGSPETIASLRRVDRRLVLLLVVSAGTQLDAAELRGYGAYGALPRPLEAVRWRQAVGAALAMAHQSRDRVSYEPLLDQEDWQEAIVGRCEAMHEVITSLPGLAKSDAPVLISGEAGTGKTMVARALHQHSERCEKPFVSIERSRPRQSSTTNGALDDYGVGSRSISSFEWVTAHYAEQGTLFIHDLGALSQEGKQDLRRLLNHEPLRSTGSRLDARVMVATREGIEEQMIGRGPTQELFDGLRACSVHLPPLRERPGDLQVLIDYFLTQSTDAFGAPAKTFAPEVISALERYHWPGNVRELERLVRRAILTSRGDTVMLGDLPPHMLDCVGVPENRHQVQPEGRVVRERWSGQGPDGMAQVSRTLFDWSRKDRRFRIIPAMERQLILHALTETRGNQLRAAKLLGISRATLRNRLDRLDIKPELVVH